MLIGHHGFNAFSEYDLSPSLDGFVSGLRKEIETDSRIESTDEEEYVRERVAEKSIAPLKLDTENITITQREEEIPARYFPNMFSLDMDEGESYPKPVITFHLPFTGDEKMLHFQPSTWLMVSENISVRDGNILFEVINFSNDADQVTKARDGVVSHLTQQADNLNRDLKQFNERLEGIVRDAVRNARVKQKSNADFLEKLGNKPNNG